MSKKYTVFNKKSKTVIATGRPWPTKDGTSTPPGLDPDVVLLEEIKQGRPAGMNTLTQKVIPADVVYDVEAGTATHGWTVVNLTQDEIDARTPAHFTTSGGIKLGVSESDQTSVANLLLLIKESGMAEDWMITIRDAHKNPHNMSVADFRATVIAYGQHCYTLFMS